MKKIATLITVLLLALPLTCLADPAPFGLQINQVSSKEVLKKYGGQKTGINKYSGGEMYKLEPSSIGFDGLNEIIVIFSTDDKLLAILTKFNKSKFNYLNDAMKSKYQLVNQNIPFVGNKSAKYLDGNTEITLDAPHMGFSMDMNYINKDLFSAYKAQVQKEEQEKKKSEASQL